MLEGKNWLISHKTSKFHQNHLLVRHYTYRRNKNKRNKILNKGTNVKIKRKQNGSPKILWWRRTLQKKVINAIKEISNNYIELQKILIAAKEFTRFLDYMLNSYWKKSTPPEINFEAYSNLNKKLLKILQIEPEWWTMS